MLRFKSCSKSCGRCCDVCDLRCTAALSYSCCKVWKPQGKGMAPSHITRVGGGATVVGVRLKGEVGGRCLGRGSDRRALPRAAAPQRPHALHKYHPRTCTTSFHQHPVVLLSTPCLPNTHMALEAGELTITLDYRTHAVPLCGFYKGPYLICIFRLCAGDFDLISSLCGLCAAVFFNCTQQKPGKPASDLKLI
jgi:hypothetical protein